MVGIFDFLLLRPAPGDPAAIIAASAMAVMIAVIRWLPAQGYIPIARASTLGALEPSHRGS
ncbi:hypothetical protein X728_26290 [Mesorhizobium sp. L103C120A0]|nr:hypothetical protein X728_26290 [Mesorhizobium sp. L103C120A0]